MAFHNDATMPLPIRQATVPVYMSDDARPPYIQHATGVLLTLGSCHFLVTAHHKTDLKSQTLYISSEDRIEHKKLDRDTLGIMVKYDDYLESPENIGDFLVLRLKAVCVKHLTNDRMFLTYNDMLILNKVKPLSILVCGYPHFRQLELFPPNSGIASQTHSPFCWLDSTRRRSDGRPHGENLMFLKFQGEVRDPSGGLPPRNDLLGFSGGGMWLSDENVITDMSNPMLVGMLHHYTPRREKGRRPRKLVGTKVEFIINQIKMKWSSVATDCDRIRRYS